MTQQEEEGSTQRGPALLRWLLAASVALAACGRATAPLGPARHAFEGRIASIDPAGASIAIAHAPIVGFGPAGEIRVKVEDAEAMRRFTVGDGIRATMLVSAGRELVFENVVATSQPPLPPDLAFADERGQRRRLSDYRGSALVLTFVLTECTNPEFCPRIMSHFAELERKIAGDPRLAPRAHLLTLGANPGRDSPEALRSYARRLDPRARLGRSGHWSFGVGQVDDTAAVARFFGLEVETRHGELTHNLRTAVLGPDGEVARIYEGNAWQPDEVASLLRTILLGRKMS